MAKKRKKNSKYPEPKSHQLTDSQRNFIINAGAGCDIYKVSKRIGCSASQVAGIKAAMTKGQL